MGNEAPDYEIIAFRASVSALFSMFALRLFFEWPREWIVPLSIVLAYTSTRTTLRVRKTIKNEREDIPVERRHKEMIAAIDKRNTYAARSQNTND